ncbi:MAG: MBL fold metallo-hydrolase [Candidatus Hodarchaeales archaeon]|jgi:glyoxylase-like metal-dependent hydrolase (beta-lactamase superfamily II)
MELVEITDNVSYIANPVNIGVIKINRNTVVLIDTGLDDSTGKKILKLLDQNNLTVHSIINTHSHADHCGGNNVIQKKTGAILYAPEIESTFIQHTFLEPWYLYSGAAPFKDLKNKFLTAKPSNVDNIIFQGQDFLPINGLRLNVISLKGHSPNQIGIEVDSICFCADVVFSEELLEKHKIPFFSDIAQSLDSLNSIKEKNYSFHVPAHATPSKTINVLVNANKSKINDISNLILTSLSEPMTVENILKKLCTDLDFQISHPTQYHLLKTPLLAHLSYLYQNNQISHALRNNQLFWKSV